MSTELVQLKVAFEDLGMTPEEIAQDREMDIVAVKAGLMQCSAKYRKACGAESDSEDNLNFDNEQLEQANKVIYDIMLSSEDDHLRFKAATYLRDDKKGRKDVAKQLGGHTFNILQFNEAMGKVRAAASQIKESLLIENGKVLPQ